tara:strand:+ start:116 stop:538 length:423 start_codon:yes stop_codon:yes gene_type:complete
MTKHKTQKNIRGGKKRRKTRRKSKSLKRRRDSQYNDDIWGKNKKLEKLWRKLADSKMVILINKNGKMIHLKLPKTHPALGNKLKELDNDDNIKAIITSASSSDVYESLYKKVKNKDPKIILKNYKKYFTNYGKGDKTWYL